MTPKELGEEVAKMTKTLIAAQGIGTLSAKVRQDVATAAALLIEIQERLAR